ncbi:MAG: hypothetical protein ACK5PF_04660, partial [bacterium]
MPATASGERLGAAIAGAKLYPYALGPRSRPSTTARGLEGSAAGRSHRGHPGRRVIRAIRVIRVAQHGSPGSFRAIRPVLA